MTPTFYMDVDFNIFSKILLFVRLIRHTIISHKSRYHIIMKKHIVATTLCMMAFALTGAAQGDLARGINAENKGLDDLASQYYRAAADTSSAARLRLGMLEARHENYRLAAHWLAQADSSAEAMAHLSACRVETRQWQPARQAAEKAIELADSSLHTVRALAMGSLALYYANREEYTNALLWVHRAESEDPASARVHNIKGVIYFKRGNENEAIQSFREALRRDPANVDAHFNLGSLYCYRNNYDMAIATLRRGLKENRRSVKLFYAFGWAYLLKGENEKALECLDNVLQIDSAYVNAYLRKGDIYRGRAEYNQAVEQYRHAARLAPDLPEPCRLLGRTYSEQGDFAKAIRNYQKAAELDPGDGETYCQIAILYGKQGRTKQEQANYKRAARLGNEEARRWCTRNAINYQ